MSKIIKKVVLIKDEYDWIGATNGELLIKDNNKDIYISISDIGEDALYYVTYQSIMDNLINTELVEQYKELYEFGPIDDYKGEKAMAKSRYYNCFKYLYSLLHMADTNTKEYVDDYEKDLDEFVNLDSIRFQNY